jgi:hypothetical protein
MYNTDRALHADNQVLKSEQFHKLFSEFYNNINNINLITIILILIIIIIIIITIKLPSLI